MWGKLDDAIFSLIKLIDLFKLVNQEMEVLIISQDGNDNLLTGLMIAYLMDTYRYNLLNSFNMIKEDRRFTIGQVLNMTLC